MSTTRILIQVRYTIHGFETPNHIFYDTLSLYFYNNTLHQQKYGNIFETNELCKQFDMLFTYLIYYETETDLTRR